MLEMSLAGQSCVSQNYVSTSSSHRTSQNSRISQNSKTTSQNSKTTSQNSKTTQAPILSLSDFLCRIQNGVLETHYQVGRTACHLQLIFLAAALYWTNFFLPLMLGISKTRLSRKSVLNGPFGEVLAEGRYSNRARYEIARDDLLKLQKALRLQKNETKALSILSKEPPISYNLFHTHEGAKSHD